MNAFEKILAILEGVVAVGASIPSPISGFAKIGDYLLKIAQSAVQAHLSITGQPMDLTKLHEIQPVV